MQREKRIVSANAPAFSIKIFVTKTHHRTPGNDYAVGIDFLSLSPTSNRWVSAFFVPAAVKDLGERFCPRCRC